MSKEQLQQAFKFIVIFGGGYLVFRALIPKSRKSLVVGQVEVTELPTDERSQIMPPPPLDPNQAANNPKSADAYLALSVYIDAINSNASPEDLNKVNDELKNDYGLKVYRRRSDNKIVVKNLNDIDVMEYDAVAAAA